jgi:hypothetical protein
MASFNSKLLVYQRVPVQLPVILDETLLVRKVEKPSFVDVDGWRLEEQSGRQGDKLTFSSMSL